MPCLPTTEAVDLTVWYPYTPVFDSKEDCEQACATAGACCKDGVCTTKKRCDCAEGGGIFMEHEQPCQPNPCNPLP